MILARNFTRLFTSRHVGQHEATRLLNAGVTLAYLTLTNDHQPRTEVPTTARGMGTVGASLLPAVPEAAAAARVLGPGATAEARGRSSFAGCRRVRARTASRIAVRVRAPPPTPTTRAAGGTML